MKYLVYFLLFSSFNVFSIGKEKKLLNLVRVEIASISKVTKRGDKLSYRLMELYSERVKLLRRLESAKLIKGGISKSEAYKESSVFYKQTQEFGAYFLKSYPTSKFVGDVYYALASNTIEVRNQLEQDEKQIVSNLKNAIKFSRDKSLKHQSMTKLAEIFYTLNKFKEASSYYEVIVKESNDPWLTKNLLNLAWCYFQLKRYPEAISLGLKSNDLSLKYKKKYSDVSDQVTKAMNYFYTFNKEPEKAIDFHVKYHPGVELEDNIIKLLNLALGHISSNSALKAEKKARYYCEKLKRVTCLYLMSQFKLNIFKDAKDYEGHFVAVGSLAREYKELTKKQRIDYTEVTNQAINNIAELSSYIQSLAYKDHYIIEGDRSKTLGRLIGNYDYLKIINEDFSYEYAFLQGEISYKEEDFEKASVFYLESHQKTKKEQHEKFYPKLFKSMISLANEKSFLNKNYFEQAYVLYINQWPKDLKTITIYDGLFRFYIQEKRQNDAVKLIDQYHVNLPQKIQDQREMFKVVMNGLISQKDTNSLNLWIKKMSKGYLKFPQEFIQQNIAILSGLLFENARNLEKEKKYKLALREYSSIYSNKDYPQKVKNDSAFNSSIIYLQINEVGKSYAWLKKSIERHIVSNIIPKLDTILSSAQKMYLLQGPKKAFNIYNFVSSKYCQKAKTYPKHFMQIQALALGLNSESKFERNLSNAKNCSISKEDITSVQKMYVDYLIENKKIDILLQKIAKNDFYDQVQNEIYVGLEDLFWESSLTSPSIASSKEFTQLQQFTERNPYLTAGSNASFSSLKRFIGFYEKTKDVALAFPEMNKFDLTKFTKVFESNMGQIVEIKKNGQAVSNGADEANVFSAVVATTYLKFDEFYQSLEDFKVTTNDQPLKKEVEKNIKLALASLSEQMQELRGEYLKADSKNLVRNMFYQFLKFDQEKKAISLYETKTVEPLEIVNHREVK